MKPNNFKSCFYFLILISIPVGAQWNDSFDDANFSKNPVWSGKTSNFEVNSDLQLHLNAPSVAGKSYLVTDSKVSRDAVWKFKVQMDFNPSSSNYAKVYLMSDRANPDSSLNGYYLRIGGVDDDVSLFRQDELSTISIIDGRDGMLDASVNKLSVQVTRDLQGKWIVSCDSSGNSEFSILGSCSDNTYLFSNYFGIQCIYTSTRSNKFSFDSFEVRGKVVSDIVPPVVSEIMPLSDSLIFIKFSEAVEVGSLNLSHFVPQIGNTIQKLQIKDSKSAVLFLSKPIPCKQREEIAITGIVDLANNIISDTTLFVSYCPGKIYDVLITEIMADPDPQVLLPNIEYVELLNGSGGEINLDKWVLQVGDDRIALPAISFPADSFLLICSSKGCNTLDSKRCLAILPYSCLNNSGEYIGLKNHKGNLIHWVSYDESFYHDELKMNGGWSIEMIDSSSPCVGKDNWMVSNDNRGGSPGKVNSTKGTVIDSKVFQFDHIFLPNDSTVRLYFSKSVDIESLSNQMFSIDNDKGYPLKLELDSSLHQYIDMVYPEAFQPNISYFLQLPDDIFDCSGNKLKETSAISFMRPSEVAKNDIIINEILFNALPEGQEFIEFYNNSNKFINSSDLRFSYRNSNPNFESALELGSYPFLIAPKAFIVVVKSVDNMERLYSIQDMSSLVVNKYFPGLNNTEGCVAVMNKSMEVLDEFCYSEKMHFNLLVNKSGVSLERIRYDISTSDLGNWHSASSTVGFATPGGVNSQYLENTESENDIFLEYEIFSPDNDGYKDVETISYRLDQPGFVANIIVFDALGRRVKIISNNQSLGTQGTITWDGIDEKGQLASTGIYLIYIELHHPSGVIKQYRRTCVLAGETKR